MDLTLSFQETVSRLKWPAYRVVEGASTAQKDSSKSERTATPAFRGVIWDEERDRPLKLGEKLDFNIFKWPDTEDDDSLYDSVKNYTSTVFKYDKMASEIEDEADVETYIEPPLQLVRRIVDGYVAEATDETTTIIIDNKTRRDGAVTDKTFKYRFLQEQTTSVISCFEVKGPLFAMDQKTLALMASDIGIDISSCPSPPTVDELSKMSNELKAKKGIWLQVSNNSYCIHRDKMIVQLLHI
jgi:hypothetical protein